MLATVIWHWLSLSVVSYASYLVVIVSCKYMTGRATTQFYRSHLRNVLSVALVGFVCLNIVLVLVVGTLGVALPIVKFVWGALVVWSCYKALKGMILLVWVAGS